MSAIQRNDSDLISDMSSPSWKPKEKTRQRRSINSVRRKATDEESTNSQVMTQPMQGLREIHLESKQDEEPSRKRPKITLGTSPPAHHDESDSTEQVLETDGSEFEIDDKTERHSWDEDESLVEKPHPEGHPDPDLQDIAPKSLANHESGGQGQVASEENEEEQTSTVDEPGWADLIELWKEHDFQWALQRNRTQPSKVRPYTPNIVFGTIVLKRQ
ncbi:hypothetical protein BGZ81_007276 [Podila clonocystis]|nr:hypothetical protein BGZ81_007276 [Podila clonocystis]